MFKKICAILLAIVLVSVCFSAVPFTVGAATSGYLTYTVANNEVTITRCQYDAKTHITIPSKIGGYPVTTIANNAFENCYYITGVTIPNTVKKIGGMAFYYCMTMSEINIPDSVTSIGYGAFYGCTNVSSITIGKGLSSIGDRVAFYHCSSVLESITVDPQNTHFKSVNNCLIESAKNKLLLGCSNSVIPDDGSVTYIESGAFTGNKNITSLYIPDTVTYIYGGSLAQCPLLKTVRLPKNITEIPLSLFNTCESLTEITIPENVVKIGDEAFNYCTSLSTVIIPNSVKTINSSAFTNCTKLSDVYFTGTEDEWKSISIGSGNTYLTNATIHYNYEIPVPCEHIFEDGMCDNCGAKMTTLENAKLTSSPLYNAGVYIYDKYTVSADNVSSIVINFAEDLTFNDESALLYIYDAAGTEITKYNQDTVKSASVEVEGNAVSLRFIASRSDLTYNAEIISLYTFEKGDADGDHEISASDTSLLRRYLLNTCELKAYQQKSADANNDKTIDVRDIVALKQILAE